MRLVCKNLHTDTFCSDSSKLWHKTEEAKVEVVGKKTICLFFLIHATGWLT